jgi:hypothetical protein
VLEELRTCGEGGVRRGSAGEVVRVRRLTGSWNESVFCWKSCDLEGGMNMRC